MSSPNEGHDFDIPTVGLGEQDYRPGYQVAWSNIDETPASTAAGSARESFLPPASPLAETYRPQIPVRAPDRYINDQQAHPEPYGRPGDGPGPVGV
jgi:hypothetical protein